MIRVAPACLAPCTELIADAADAHDDGHVARTIPAPLTAEPQPVGTPQPTRQASLNPMSSGIFTQLMAGNDGVLRERRDHRHLPDILPVLVHPEGAIELAAGQQHGPRVAQVLLAAGAPAAPPAAGDELQHDVIAGGHVGDVGPDRLHDAGAFVPAGDGQLHGRHVAGAHVIVGMAEPRGHDLDQHLGGLRLVEVDLGDLPLPGCEKSTAALVFMIPLRSSVTVVGQSGLRNVPVQYRGRATAPGWTAPGHTRPRRRRR